MLHGFQPRILIGEIQLGTVIRDITRLDQLNELTEARSIAIDNIKQTHVVNKESFDKRRQPLESNIPDDKPINRKFNPVNKE